MPGCNKRTNKTVHKNSLASRTKRPSEEIQFSEVKVAKDIKTVINE